MTDEKETVGGVAEKINLWKKKPGFFLTLEGVDQEFYGFGTCPVEVGQEVFFEVSPGTGNFSDKVKLDKLLNVPRLKEKIKVKAKEEVKEMEDIIAKGDKVYFDKQELIVKQCCLKAAAMVVGHLQIRSEVPDWVDIKEKVVDMADRFYCYICRGEGPEEPLPEEK